MQSPKGFDLSGALFIGVSSQNSHTSTGWSAKNETVIGVSGSAPLGNFGGVSLSRERNIDGSPGSTSLQLELGTSKKKFEAKGGLYNKLSVSYNSGTSNISGK